MAELWDKDRIDKVMFLTCVIAVSALKGDASNCKPLVGHNEDSKGSELDSKPMGGPDSRGGPASDPGDIKNTADIESTLAVWRRSWQPTN